MIYDQASSRYRDEVYESLVVRQAELGQIEEARTGVRSITNDARRAHALFRIALTSSEPLRSEAAEEALHCILALSDKTPLEVGPGTSGSWLVNREWKAHALGRLAEFIPSHLLPDAIRAFVDISDGKPSIDDKLVRRLAGLGRSELLHNLWCDTVHAVALGERTDLVRVLVVLRPVANILAGSEVAESLADAIDDVRNRWP
jgi:hypothetical protein